MLQKELEIRGSKLFLIDRKFHDYHEIDVTPVFQWCKEFFEWKQAGQPIGLEYSTPPEL